MHSTFGEGGYLVLGKLVRIKDASGEIPLFHLVMKGKGRWTWAGVSRREGRCTRPGRHPVYKGPLCRQDTAKQQFAEQFGM